MSDKDVNIRIHSQATGNGIKQTEKDLNNLEQDVPPVVRTLTVMEQEVRDLEKALRSVSPASQDFQTTAERLGQVRLELGNALDKADDFAKKSGGAAGASRNFGQTISQVGFQAQDFAVQVGGGTSALTALAQQGSQILGILGPAGAMAGAALAIGAVVAKLVMARSEGEATKKVVEELDDVISSLNESIAARNREVMEAKNADAIKAEADALEAYNQKVLRSIEAIRQREELNSKIRQNQAELDLLSLKGLEDRGEISKSDAAMRRTEIEARMEREKLLRSEDLAILNEMTFQVQIETAKKELERAKIEAKNAEEMLKQEQDLSERIRILDAGANAARRAAEIEKAGGREAGYPLEPFIDIDRRRQELDRIQPQRETGLGLLGLAGFKFSSADKELQVFLDEIKKLEATYDELPKASLDAAQAVRDAERKLQELESALRSSKDLADRQTQVDALSALRDRLQESQDDFRMAGEEAGSEIARIFDTWVQQLGAAANQGRNAETVEQVRAILADGLQSDDADAVLTLAQELARSINANTAKSAAAFNMLISTISSSSSRLDAAIRDIRRLEDQVRQQAKVR